MQNIRRVIFSCLIAVFMEIILFNFPAVINTLRGYSPIYYAASDLCYLNWVNQEDGSKISLPDPIIYVDGLSLKAETLTIQVDADSIPDTYAIFYTTEVTENFHEGKLILLETDGEQEITLPINLEVCGIRVDLGASEGLVLNDICLIVNNIGWNISVARIIAMLVVFWGTFGLALLQKSPDYGITEKE